MREFLFGILLITGIILFALALIWIGQGSDFFLYKYFAPKYEQVRRETFENTQSYVEGKRQDLVRYRLEYLREKDPVAKKAIKETIVQSFTNFDENKIIDADLRTFLHDMMYTP